jgi:hypothetical protein
MDRLDPLEFFLLSVALNKIHLYVVILTQLVLLVEELFIPIEEIFSLSYEHYY